MNCLTTIRGDTEEYTISLVDDAGDPFDLTDCGLTFTVRDLLVKTETDGIAFALDPTSGVAVNTIDAGDTAGAPDVRTSYPYDVQVTTSAGIVRTPLRGRFIVIPDVTTP